MTLEHLDTALGFAVIMLLLSLLITVLVQASIAVLGLRGSNLRWGVAQLLQQIDPGLENDAKNIAERVLQHPSIAPIWKRKATAIRAAELVRILDDLGRTGDQSTRTALQGILKEVAPGRAAELGGQAEAVVAQLAALFPAQAGAVRDAVAQALGTTRKLVAGVNTWFDTIISRTSDRFVLQTRWITAAAALAFAVLLHVDSLQLLQRLASDSEFRSKVVAASQGTLQRAEDVVALTAERKAPASGAVAAAREDLRSLPAAAALGDAPATLVTRDQGAAWIRERLKGSASTDTILAVYNRRFDEATQTWLAELRGSTSAIQDQLAQVTFQVIPDPFPPFSKYVTEPRHLVGTLMSVLFLSLGAPFWFNVLRQLANLRPAIAQKVAEGTAQ